MHAFLRYLRSAGLECVPAPVGLDAGVETLTYLPGRVGQGRVVRAASDDGAAVGGATLLRRIHDASVGWSPPDDAVWARLRCRATTR